MARPLRIQEAGLIYHVMARGNARMTIFCDDDDRRRFLDIMAEVIDVYRLICHAYALMSNHYHGVFTTLRPNLSKAMRQLNGTYAQWWNGRHGRVGHVFQGRFKAQIVQDDRYFLTVCCYVVLNPVRRHVVQNPGDSPWTSYRATAGLAPVPSFLSLDLVLSQCGHSDTARAIDRYRELVTSLAALDGCPVASSPVIGDDEFVARFKAWRERASREVPGCERDPQRPSLDALFREAVTRGARQAGMTAAYRHGYSMAEIARYLDVHYSTISRGIAAVSGLAKPSDARPDP